MASLGWIAQELTHNNQSSVGVGWPEGTFFFMKNNYGLIIDERRRYVDKDKVNVWIKDPSLYFELVGVDHYPGTMYFPFKGEETVRHLEALLEIV